MTAKEFKWHTYSSVRSLPKKSWIRRYWEVAQGWLYGGDRDIVVKYERAKLVRPRFDQMCMGEYHPHGGGVSEKEWRESATIKAGTLCIVETAWCDQSDRFGSCYTCFDCIRKSEAELKR